MTGQVSQDSSGSDEPREEAGSGEFGNAGVGAASALEHMKSQHERRRRHVHGETPPSAEREGDGARH